MGRILNRAMVEREPPRYDASPGVLCLSLYDPDYTTVQCIEESINDVYPLSATAIDDASLTVTMSEEMRTSGGTVRFISAIEHIEIVPDSRARVVTNEKTGTIVAGGNVSIAPVTLAHDNITVEIKSYPVISQRAPFSDSKTVETKDTYINVTEENARIVHFPERSTISEIASALNAIGASPRDIIAIFQAIKQVGALRAELIIL